MDHMERLCSHIWRAWDFGGKEAAGIQQKQEEGAKVEIGFLTAWEGAGLGEERKSPPRHPSTKAA